MGVWGAVYGSGLHLMLRWVEEWERTYRRGVPAIAAAGGHGLLVSLTFRLVNRLWGRGVVEPFLRLILLV